MCRVAPPTPSSDREVNHVEGAWRQISKNEDRGKFAEWAASGDNQQGARPPTPSSDREVNYVEGGAGAKFPRMKTVRNWPN